MGDIFGKALSNLKAFMDYHVSRHGVISSNIANQDTPGYKAKDISFDEELESRLSLTRTHPAHQQSQDSEIKYTVQEDPYERIGNDGNTVDLDREMMKIAQNDILYNAAVETMQYEIELLKNTIRSIR
jgi:flagellar basal-body rod protein FlgB